MNKFSCSDDEYSALFEQYGKLIHNFANKYANSCTGYDHDDMVQEGTITMLKAKNMFNKSKNTKFGTYLYTAIRRRFNVISKECKEKNEAKKTIIKAWEKEADNSISEKKVNSHKLSNDKDLKIMFRDALENLSEADKKIIKMRIEGRTYLEISSVLNCSPQYIKIRQSKAFKKIRRKLQ